MLGKLNRYLAGISIFLITAALIAGMAGCDGASVYRHSLIMAVAPSGGGMATDLTNASPYYAGTLVTIKAEANEGYLFAEWEATAGTFANANFAETTFTIPAQNVTVTANFALLPGWYYLTISSTPGGSVTEPGVGTHVYSDNTVVPLVAEANTGYQFVGWTGNVTTIADVGAASTNITMNDFYSITANFALEIWDWYDLNAIRAKSGGSYVLMNDLNSTTPGYKWLASPTANGGKGWAPIGTQTDPFTWSFNGQGYEIRDLYINRLDEMYIGLFGIIGEGWQIEEIGVANVTVFGQDYVGGLVGGNYLGIVSNCYATGIVYGSDDVGGLAGISFGTISNSYSTGSVTGNSRVGGLVGNNWRWGNNWGGTVNNSYSIDSVSGHNRVGGLVGQSYNGTISNSHSTGNVTGDDCVGGLVGWHADIVRNSYSNCNVTGNSHVGGLVGCTYAPAGTVSNSYSTGSVTGNSSVGGLVGENDANVSNSYSTGNVTGTSNVGGLVGENSQGSVSNSYSTGSVSGNSSVGGLVGWAHLSTVSNSYSTGSVSGNSSVGGLVGWAHLSTVSNSYSTGSVSGNSSVGGLAGGIHLSTLSNSYSSGSVYGSIYVGGLVGRNWYSTVSNSFWDTQTSGQATSDGGTGENTMQMQDITTFSGAGWNIIGVANPSTRNPSYIWNIVNNVTYPFLSW
jgi:hypothetical protein